MNEFQFYREEEEALTRCPWSHVTGMNDHNQAELSFNLFLFIRTPTLLETSTLKLHIAGVHLETVVHLLFRPVFLQCSVSELHLTVLCWQMVDL